MNPIELAPGRCNAGIEYADSAPDEATGLRPIRKICLQDDSFVVGDRLDPGPHRRADAGTRTRVYGAVSNRGIPWALKQYRVSPPLPNRHAATYADVCREVDITVKAYGHEVDVLFVRDDCDGVTRLSVLMPLRRGDLGRFRQPSEGAVINLILQVGQELLRLHDKGIVHNHIKLRNIIFDRGVLRLIDFSSAVENVPGENRQPPRIRRSSWSRAAPELIAAPDGVSFEDALQAEAWSLGLACMELFAVRPFRSIVEEAKAGPGDSTPRIAAAMTQATGDFERVRTRRPTNSKYAPSLQCAWFNTDQMIDGSVRKIVSRLLTHDPKQRLSIALAVRVIMAGLTTSHLPQGELPWGETRPADVNERDYWQNLPANQPLKALCEAHQPAVELGRPERLPGVELEEMQDESLLDHLDEPNIDLAMHRPLAPDVDTLKFGITGIAVGLAVGLGGVVASFAFLPSLAMYLVPAATLLGGLVATAITWFLWFRSADTLTTSWEPSTASGL